MYLLSTSVFLRTPSFCDFCGQDRNLVKSLRYDSQFYKTAAPGEGRLLMVAWVVVMEFTLNYHNRDL